MRLDSHNPESQPAQEKVSLAQVKKQSRHIGTINPHNGHTLWEYNIETKEIVPAEFHGNTTIDFPIDGEPVKINKRVMVKESCLYLSSLNKKSALKKINKTHDTAHRLYKENFELINEYLANAVTMWFDYAEKNASEEKRTELLQMLNDDWNKWIYAKSPEVHVYYSHLFYERWGQTIQLIAASKNNSEESLDK